MADEFKGIIKIEDLEVYYRVGVPDSERERAQRLLVCIEMEYPFAQACESDEISKTIDYQLVVDRLIQFGNGKSWHLLEKLAFDIAEMILNDFDVKEVTVEVKKFIISQTKYISVRLTRSRKAND